MYLLGVPVGIFVDRRGPRLFVIFGAVLLAAGYFPLHVAYDRASGSVAALCLFSFLTGLGGCMAFAASVKTSALNWPSHRGTATAFPLAAFGLSAFFFSSLGAMLFPGDPSAFLKLLSWGSSSLTLVGFFFLKVYPHRHSNHEPDLIRDARRSSSASAHMRPSSAQLQPSGSRYPDDVGTYPGPTSKTTQSPSSSSEPSPSDRITGNGVEETAIEEASSLLSSRASESVENVMASSVDTDRSHRIDIRGLRLFRSQSFWFLFLIMAILAGVGLMTIK